MMSRNTVVLFVVMVLGVLLGINVSAQNAAKSTKAGSAALPPDIDPVSRYRLPMANREEMDDYGKKVYDELIKSTPATVRLHSPRLAKPMADAHHYLKFETGLGDRLTEVAVLTTARELDNQYEWTQWEEHGRNAKDARHVEGATIDVIKFCKPVTGLGEKEAAIIKLGREMFGVKKVSSATFADVLRLFGRRATVDLVELMALYGATGAELVAFDMQLGVNQKPLLPARASIPACKR
ncbi:MAG TPA: hypothetical protein VG892_01955 [Terriglobales bacterium]|nr:hypothetical protein [Terriglobales bacterium]